jgi:hypothetical protein
MALFGGSRSLISNGISKFRANPVSDGTLIGRHSFVPLVPLVSLVSPTGSDGQERQSVFRRATKTASLSSADPNGERGPSAPCLRELSLTTGPDRWLTPPARPSPSLTTGPDRGLTPPARPDVAVAIAHHRTGQGANAPRSPGRRRLPKGQDMHNKAKDNGKGHAQQSHNSHLCRRVRPVPDGLIWREFGDGPLTALLAHRTYYTNILKGASADDDCFRSLD